jgi:opacity protein-like surface antigen
MKRSLLLSTAALGIAMLPLGAAEAQDRFEGFYLGIHGGYGTGNVNVEEMFGGEIDFGGPIDGFIGGALAGYNFHRPPDRKVMLGVEADVGFGDISGVGDTGPEVYNYDMPGNFHGRIRIGLPSDSFMPFVAGGVAVSKLNIDEYYAGTFVGGTVGAGVEALVGPNLAVRGEGLLDVFAPKNVEYEPGEWGEVSLSVFTARVALILLLPP